MITQDLAIPSIVFTFEVEHLIFNAGGASKVYVTLKEVKSSTNKETIFSSSYITPPNGKVKVYEVASLLENRLEQNGASYISIECTAQGNSSSDVCTIKFLAFYCKRYLPISFADFNKQRFLTTALSRLTTKDAVECLHFYCSPNSGSSAALTPLYYYVTALIKMEDGTVENYSYNMNAQTGFRTRYFSFEQILSIIPTIPATRQFIGYKVRLGTGPEYSFYFTDCRPTRMFYFLNCFNVYELAIIPSATTHKLETEFSTAVCAGETSQYDVAHHRSYETQSSALLITQAAWLTQFLTSPDIRLYTGGNEAEIVDMPKVLINDYDIELSDEPGQVNSFNFEWQFANAREMLNPLDGFESSCRIFTEQFSSPFA